MHETSEEIQIVQEMTRDVRSLHRKLNTAYTIRSRAYESQRNGNHPVIHPETKRELTISEMDNISSKTIKYKNDLLESFKKLQETCSFSNIYSEFSRFIDYTKTYDQELNKFLDDYIDSVESDFILRQINLFENLPMNLNFLEKELKYTCKRKIEFLNDKLESLKGIEEDPSKKPLSNFKTVFLLKELGVIDFLSKRPMIKENIAHLIGMINGRHPKNISDFISTVPSRGEIKNLGHKQKLDTQYIVDVIDKL